LYEHFCIFAVCGCQSRDKNYFFLLVILTLFVLLGIDSQEKVRNKKSTTSVLKTKKPIRQRSHEIENLDAIFDDANSHLKCTMPLVETSIQERISNFTESLYDEFSETNAKEQVQSMLIETFESTWMGKNKC